MRLMRMVVPVVLLLAVSGVCSAQSVSVSPSPAVVNEPITVTWTAPSPNPLDWIGLYAVGDPDTSYQTFFFTNGTTSGSKTMYAPSAPGNYEFRYFVNNSFTSVATSNTLVVTNTAGFSVTITPSSAAPGAPISVTWTAPAGRPADDWIGIYAAGETDNHNYDPLRWVYTGGAATGTFNTTMPNYGPIVARYLMRNLYSHAAESNQVLLAYSVSASPTTVAQGGTITVNWSAPPGASTTDWVGLFKVGTASHQWYQFVYTGGTSIGGTTFTAPFDPGQYEVRYYLNGTSNLAAVSQVITVQ